MSIVERKKHLKKQRIEIKKDNIKQTKKK